MKQHGKGRASELGGEVPSSSFNMTGEIQRMKRHGRKVMQTPVVAGGRIEGTRVIRR